MAEFLSKGQLKRLEVHKYSCEGRSLFERLFLCDLWDKAMYYVPMSWAPNAMTLTGVIFMVIPFIMLMATNPDAKGENVPSYVYFAMAFGIFAFQLLDNLDGRQARRTQKSGNPLGEFFDHGCDTISDFCMTLSVVIAIEIGHWPNIFFVMGLIVIQDYCFYWRAHWTGKYVFGDIDVSEIQWLLIVIISLTGLTGQTIWELTFFGLFKFKTFLILFYFGFVLYYLGDVWFDAIKIGFFTSSSTVADARTRRNVLAPMYPLAINILMAISARYLSDNIFERYPIAFLSVYCIIVAKLSCRLLIANMTRTRMVTFDSSMLAFMFMFLSNTSSSSWFITIPASIQMSPSAALFVAGAFAIFDFIKYTIAVCSQLADHFDICCLTLERPNRMRQQETDK